MSSTPAPKDGDKKPLETLWALLRRNERELARWNRQTRGMFDGAAATLHVPAAPQDPDAVVQELDTATLRMQDVWSWAEQLSEVLAVRQSTTPNVPRVFVDYGPDGFARALALGLGTEAVRYYVHCNSVDQAKMERQLEELKDAFEGITETADKEKKKTASTVDRFLLRRLRQQPIRFWHLGAGVTDAPESVYNLPADHAAVFIINNLAHAGAYLQTQLRSSNHLLQREYDTVQDGPVVRQRDVLRAPAVLHRMDTIAAAVRDKMVAFHPPAQDELNYSSTAFLSWFAGIKQQLLSSSVHYLVLCHPLHVPASGDEFSLLQQSYLNAAFVLHDWTQPVVATKRATDMREDGRSSSQLVAALPQVAWQTHQGELPGTPLSIPTLVFRRSFQRGTTRERRVSDWNNNHPTTLIWLYGADQDVPYDAAVHEALFSFTAAELPHQLPPSLWSQVGAQTMSGNDYHTCMDILKLLPKGRASRGLDILWFNYGVCPRALFLQGMVAQSKWKLKDSHVEEERKGDETLTLVRNAPLRNVVASPSVQAVAVNDALVACATANLWNDKLPNAQCNMQLAAVQSEHIPALQKLTAAYLAHGAPAHEVDLQQQTRVLDEVVAEALGVLLPTHRSTPASALDLHASKLVVIVLNNDMLLPQQSLQLLRAVLSYCSNLVLSKKRPTSVVLQRALPAQPLRDALQELHRGDVTRFGDVSKVPYVWQAARFCELTPDTHLDYVFTKNSKTTPEPPVTATPAALEVKRIAPPPVRPTDAVSLALARDRLGIRKVAVPKAAAVAATTTTTTTTPTPKRLPTGSRRKTIPDAERQRSLMQLVARAKALCADSHSLMSVRLLEQFEAEQGQLLLLLQEQDNPSDTELTRLQKRFQKRIDDSNETYDRNVDALERFLLAYTGQEVAMTSDGSSSQHSDISVVVSSSDGDVASVDSSSSSSSSSSSAAATTSPVVSVSFVAPAAKLSPAATRLVDLENEVTIVDIMAAWLSGQLSASMSAWMTAMLQDVKVALQMDDDEDSVRGKALRAMERRLETALHGPLKENVERGIRASLQMNDISIDTWYQNLYTRRFSLSVEAVFGEDGGLNHQDAFAEAHKINEQFKAQYNEWMEHKQRAVRRLQTLAKSNTDIHKYCEEKLREALGNSLMLRATLLLYDVQAEELTPEKRLDELHERFHSRWLPRFKRQFTDAVTRLHLGCNTAVLALRAAFASHVEHLQRMAVDMRLGKLEQLQQNYQVHPIAAAMAERHVVELLGSNGALLRLLRQNRSQGRVDTSELSDMLVLGPKSPNGIRLQEMAMAAWSVEEGGDNSRELQRHTAQVRNTLEVLATDRALSTGGYNIPSEAKLQEMEREIPPILWQLMLFYYATGVEPNFRAGAGRVGDSPSSEDDEDEEDSGDDSDESQSSEESIMNEEQEEERRAAEDRWMHDAIVRSHMSAPVDTALLAQAIMPLYDTFLEHMGEGRPIPPPERPPERATLEKFQAAHPDSTAGAAMGQLTVGMRHFELLRDLEERALQELERLHVNSTSTDRHALDKVMYALKALIQFEQDREKQLERVTNLTGSEAVAAADAAIWFMHQRAAHPPPDAVAQFELASTFRDVVFNDLYMFLARVIVHELAKVALAVESDSSMAVRAQVLGDLINYIVRGTLALDTPRHLTHTAHLLDAYDGLLRWESDKPTIEQDEVLMGVHRELARLAENVVANEAVFMDFATGDYVHEPLMSLVDRLLKDGFDSTLGEAYVTDAFLRDLFADDVRDIGRRYVREAQLMALNALQEYCIDLLLSFTTRDVEVQEETSITERVLSPGTGVLASVDDMNLAGVDGSPSAESLLSCLRDLQENVHFERGMFARYFRGYQEDDLLPVTDATAKLLTREQSRFDVEDAKEIDKALKHDLELADARGAEYQSFVEDIREFADGMTAARLVQWFYCSIAHTIEFLRKDGVRKWRNYALDISTDSKGVGRLDVIGVEHSNRATQEYWAWTHTTLLAQLHVMQDVFLLRSHEPQLALDSLRRTSVTRQICVVPLLAARSWEELRPTSLVDLLYTLYQQTVIGGRKDQFPAFANQWSDQGHLEHWSDVIMLLKLEGSFMPPAAARVTTNADFLCDGLFSAAWPVHAPSAEELHVFVPNGVRVDVDRARASYRLQFEFTDAEADRYNEWEELNDVEDDLFDDQVSMVGDLSESQSLSQDPNTPEGAAAALAVTPTVSSLSVVSVLGSKRALASPLSISPEQQQQVKRAQTLASPDLLVSLAHPHLPSHEEQRLLAAPFVKQSPPVLNDNGELLVEQVLDDEALHGASPEQQLASLLPILENSVMWLGDVHTTVSARPTPVSHTVGNMVSSLATESPFAPRDRVLPGRAPLASRVVPKADLAALRRTLRADGDDDLVDAFDNYFNNHIFLEHGERELSGSGALSVIRRELRTNSTYARYMSAIQMRMMLDAINQLLPEVIELD